MSFVHPHKEFIHQKLTDIFSPTYLEVLDESYMHAGGSNAGSHYKVIMVSYLFEDLNLIQRQRLVYKNLLELIPGKIHALSLKLYTAQEWQAEPKIFDSPKCLGKNPNFS